jgi:steroid delta-isomerase-like uncharacterized protein
MSAERNKAVVTRLVVEAEQNGNLAVLDELLSADFVDHTPLPGHSPDKAGVRALFAALKGAFPDLRITIHDQVADEAGVATRKTFQGTHQGSFLGVPASGGQLDLTVIDILKVREGRITDHWVVLDQMTLLTQIGALQPQA